MNYRFVMSFMEYIGPGDHTRRVVESAKRAKKTNLEELPPDVVEKIFEFSNCQERSQLCKTSREFAKLCRTESHKEKCNPKSAEARAVQEEFDALMRMRSLNLNPWNGGFDFNRASNLFTIFDALRFALYLKDDAVWENVKEMKRLREDIVYKLIDDDSQHVDFTRQVTFREQGYGAQRFRTFLPLLSEIQFGKTNLKNFTYVLENISPIKITNLTFHGKAVSTNMSTNLWRKNGALSQTFRVIESMKNLQFLTLTYTSIGDSLSGAVANMPVLRYLDLRGNNITSIDLSKKSNQLRHLVLSNNKLKTINVTELRNLMHLDLADNELTTIDLHKNTKLSSLMMQKNRLIEIILPPEENFEGSITGWNLSHNLLEELPSNFWKIMDFGTVYLHHNRLKSLHFDHFPYKSPLAGFIYEFYINDNNLTSLPATFQNWTNGPRWRVDVADLRNNELDLKIYPKAENIVVDVKTLKAILSDEEHREKYKYSWLYDGDFFLGKLDFGNLRPTYGGH